MSRFFVFVGVLLCALSGAFGQTQPPSTFDPQKSWEQNSAKWQEFASYDGRFKITAPAVFTEKIDTVNSDVGELVYHTFFLQPPNADAENEVYMVSYLDYPEGTVHHDSLELVGALFDETQAAAEESVRGTLRFSRDGFQGVFPYRYWRIDYLNDRASIRSKAFVAGHRFYLVQTVTQRSYGMNRSTDRFLDSFVVFTPKEEKQR